jgi:RHS repeat-associated protein
LYNLSGALIEETYPSGRVVKNTLDADGDLQQIQSSKANGTFRNYANSFNYTAAGAVSSMRLGNGKWENTTFNSRLQPTQIGLGSSATDTGLLKLNYTYNTPNIADNNGDVKSQTITVNRSNQSPLVFTQSYVYDSLNRLKSAEEVTGTTSNWKQTYTFDRYGNRRFDQSNTTFPASFANPNVTNPTIDAANNRFTTGQGWTYDLAGNVITDAESRTFFYDSENKQVEVRNSSSATLGTYSFDGDGKRVKKTGTAPNGQPELTIFVYDAGGKLVAEYSTVVAPVETAKVEYLTNDNLGTPRINTDALGNVVSRTDYMPYGEEIIALGGRSSSDKYVADDVRQGFTGYINDEETGLDYAQARMYAKGLGRFTGADPSLGSGRPSLAQSWNRYVYTLNNPLKLVDPTGLYDNSSLDDAQKENFRNQMKEMEKRLKDIKKTYGKNSEEYKEAERSFKSYGCEAGARGCSEKVGSSQVFIKAGTLAVGTGAQEEMNADGKTVTVTLDKNQLSNKASDMVADIAHEGVHAQDALDYLNSKKQTKVTDYDSERRAYVVTSAMTEIVSSGATRMVGGAHYSIWSDSWKTANPKLSAIENVRNERNKAIDNLLAVPVNKGGDGLSPSNPGHSYFP